MDRLLHRLADWKAKRNGAQVIIFDGAAEVEKTRAFLKGTIVGVGLAVLALALTGPTTIDPVLASEIEKQEDLLRESNSRAAQAIRVADMCVETAQKLERTLATYQEFLGASPSQVN